MSESRPRILTFSSLFPSSARPQAGLFIRERMFRVAQHLPLTVVSPVPWFPLQGIVRLFRPGYRPMPPRREVQNGIEIWYPRFLALPGIGRGLDGLSMALCSLPLLKRLRREKGIDVIDAHFAYPDGYAASLLGRWLRIPVTITLRGTEVPHARDPVKRRRILYALKCASRVIAVADALKRHAVNLGAQADKIQVVGNGVDTAKFYPEPRDEARRRFDIPADVPVLISVGGLVERKGFHRVIDCLPELVRQYPGLLYLIVGGASPEGNFESVLRRRVAELGLEEHVRFLGAMAPEALRWPLSAADVFVLATANEGWANVFLEAMACGLPVVATDVGGNREVVTMSDLGSIVPFGDEKALVDALARAIATPWNRQGIRVYAAGQSWDEQVRALIGTFNALVGAAA